MESIENTENTVELNETNASVGPFEIEEKSTQVPEPEPETKVEPEVTEVKEEVNVEEPKVEEQPKRRRGRSAEVKVEEPKVDEKLQKGDVVADSELLFKLSHAEVFHDLLEAARYYKTTNYEIHSGGKNFPSFIIVTKCRVKHYCITKADAIKFNFNGKR